jgi:hypothetical protein
MSEFKFACPVCGQHITADSSNSGGQLECPTCFQKIVIPQAPSSDDRKFILSASQVAKPRPTSTVPGDSTVIKAGSDWKTLVFWIVLGVLALGCGTAAYIYRDRLFPAKPDSSKMAGNTPGQPKPKPPPPPKVEYAIPTNVAWSLELTNIVIPEGAAVGSIHGSGFFCEGATLQGGALTLRQGRSGPPDLGITIRLFAEQGEQLSGKTIVIEADREPPLPKVTLRWKDERQEAKTENINDGYAMKLAFGQAQNGRMPGKIFISLPDTAKSFIAGTFEARIRKPSPPKQKG